MLSFDLFYSMSAIFNQRRRILRIARASPGVVGSMIVFAPSTSF